MGVKTDIDALPVVDGFRFAGVKAGIKASSALDLGAIVADDAVSAAGVYTRNRMRAAPVEICVERLKRGSVRAVLVNSGNANAATGAQGDRAARSNTLAFATQLGLDADEVLPASTGVIGVQLPVGQINAAMPELAGALDPGSAADFARAIMTTDRYPKVAHTEIKLGRQKARVLGIAKGAGMIHPDMATTLGFVVTDAPIGRAFLKRALKSAVDRSFNCITVDGDTSTNDTIVAMASGRVDAPTLKGEGVASARFEKAIFEVLESLGRMIVADGEGAEHLVRIEVVGAASERAARQVARTIATSQLVKTALHGCDPNWGRIMAAAGRAGVAFDPEDAEVRIGDSVVFRGGAPVGGAESESAATAVMGLPEYTIRVKLGRGIGRAHYDTADLGHEYVRINADYRT